MKLNKRAVCLSNLVLKVPTITTEELEKVAFRDVLSGTAGGESRQHIPRSSDERGGPGTLSSGEGRI